MGSITGKSADPINKQPPFPAEKNRRRKTFIRKGDRYCSIAGTSKAVNCPQGIRIREKLKEADKAFRPLPYKIGINVVRVFMLRRSRKG